MLLVFLVSMKNFSSNNLYNIINFKKANYDYIKLKDDKFFDQKYLDLKKFILTIIILIVYKYFLTMQSFHI